MTTTPLELGRSNQQRNRTARRDMGRMRGVHFDRYCIIAVMFLCTLLQIYIHVQGQDTFFFAWASALLHTFWTGRGLLVCLILYLGWEHVFGGMVLLINILYTLYCTRTSTRCESTRWVEELSECFLPLCRFFFSFSFCKKF